MKSSFLLLLLSSCSSYLAGMQKASPNTLETIDELRMEIGDLRHSLNAAQTELSLLDEKVNEKKRTPKQDPKLQEMIQQISRLEHKVQSLEKGQERTGSDLKQIVAQCNQVTVVLGQYREKIREMEQEVSLQNQHLDEVTKLSRTLTSLAKTSSEKTHRVRSGETLGEIARKQNTTIEILKKLNGLQNDKIIVGQELKLPSDRNF